MFVVDRELFVLRIQVQHFCQGLRCVCFRKKYDLPPGNLWSEKISFFQYSSAISS